MQHELITSLICFLLPYDAMPYVIENVSEHAAVTKHATPASLGNLYSRNSKGTIIRKFPKLNRNAIVLGKKVKHWNAEELQVYLQSIQ